MSLDGDSECTGTEHVPVVPSPLPFTSESIAIPAEIVFHIGTYLQYDDYRNLMSAVFPGVPLIVIAPKALWQLPTRDITIPFFNGKPLCVEYNFDPSRRVQILVNVNNLLPLFGEVPPPGGFIFKSILKLERFTRQNIHLNRCSDYQYASCKCHLGRPEQRPNPTQDACEHNHFHHYCAEHVADWLKFFLDTSVVIRETGMCHDVKAADTFLSILIHIICAIQDLGPQNIC